MTDSANRVSSDIVIDLAKTGDVAPWMALAERMAVLFGPMPDFEPILHRKIGRRQAYCARSTGGASSFLGAVLVGQQPNAHWIRWLAVFPDHHRRGIGRMLVQTALSAFPGKAPVYVDTFCDGSPAATAARRLYESCGFRPIEIVRADGVLRQRYRRQAGPVTKP